MFASPTPGLSDEQLILQCRQQLSNHFQSMGLQPRGFEDWSQAFLRARSVFVQRWADMPFINPEPQTKVINAHPQSVAVLRSSDAWGEGVLLLAASETASTHPGKMDGAVDAANRVSQLLETLLS